MVTNFSLGSDNPLDIMKVVSSFSSQWVVNAYFAVDTFFFISGFLTGFLFFKYVGLYPYS